MARINVDDEFWRDPRLDSLRELIGKESAVGAVICLWDLGMAYWKRDHHPIPEDVFTRLKFAKQLVECHFATKKEDGYYVKGARDRWSFLVAMSAAGRKSAAVRAQKYGSAIPPHARNAPKPTEPSKPATEGYRTPTERPPNATEPSSSLSSSFSKTLKTKERKKTAIAEVPAIAVPPDLGKNVSIFLGTYVSAWQARYKTKRRPDVGGKVVGEIKRFLKDRPIAESLDLIQVYCQMTDPWFEKKYHDLITFFCNVPKIVVALDRGRADPSTRSWEDIADEEENKTRVLRDSSA